MLKQRDVDSLTNLWPACLPGVQRTTKPMLTNLWPACLPGVQRTTKATLAHLWPACWCAWRATHNQAHHESTPITVLPPSSSCPQEHENKWACHRSDRREPALSLPVPLFTHGAPLI